MLTFEKVVETISKAMLPAQVEMLSRIVYGPNPTLKQQLELSIRADRFEAHSILSHVLGHTMSDENNRAYIVEQLGLGDNS